MKLAHGALACAFVSGLCVVGVLWMCANEPTESLEPQSSSGSESTARAPADPVREPFRADLVPLEGEVGAMREPPREELHDRPRAPRAIVLATHVKGRVRGTAGSGLSPARVVAGRRGTAQAIEVRAAADGAFELDLESRGSFDVVATDGVRVSAPIPIEGGDGVTIDVGELELEECVVVAGRVVDAFGRAVEGADVRSPWATTISDSRGAFELPVGAAGLVSLEASAPGRGVGVSAILAPSEEPCVVVLEPAVEIHGNVVDATGAPVAECEVRSAGVAVRTDARGEFRLPPSRDPRPFVVARHPRAGSGRAEFAGESPLRIVLTRTAALALAFDRALDAATTELVVELIRETVMGASAERATFGVAVDWLAPDRVRIAGLAPGETYRVRIVDTRGFSAMTTLRVPDPAPEADVFAICVLEEGADIEVRVVAADGQDLEHASVTLAVSDEATADVLWAMTRRTDRKGVATFESRPNERHVVRVSARGFTETVEHIERAQAGERRTSTIRLRATSRIVGRVPRPVAADRAPWIRVSTKNATRWTRVTAQGAFVFESMPADACVVTCWPSSLPRTIAVHGGPDLPSKALELEPGATHEIEFAEDVSKPVTCRVRVVDSSGVPRVSMRVAARVGDAEVASARTAADGTVHLVLPWAGVYRLEAKGDRESDPSAVRERVTCEGEENAIEQLVVQGQ